MVAERAAPWLDEVIAAGHGGADGGRHEQRSGEPDAEPRETPRTCGWCPLCAIVAMVRGERPELAARVMEQAAQLVALLRAVLADRWEPQEGVHMPGFRPAEEPEPFRREPRADSDRVQHITVRRSAEWER
jgi:hypothetical protein